MRTTMVAIFGVALLSATTAFAQSLSDSEARHLMEKKFNEFVQYIPIGPIDIVPQAQRGSSPCVTRILSQEDYKVVLGLAKAGILDVANDPSFERFKSGEGFSWDQMLQMTTGGVSKKVVISATEKARPFDVTEKLSPEKRFKGCVAFRTGRVTVSKIVRNEHYRRNVHDYRVLMLTYTNVLEPHFKVAFESTNRSVAPNLKAMVLIKNDAFSGEWKTVALDIREADKEFISDAVEKALAGAQ